MGDAKSIFESMRRYGQERGSGSPMTLAPKECDVLVAYFEQAEANAKELEDFKDGGAA